MCRIARENEYDQPNDEWCGGMAGSNVFLVFYETIRDGVSTHSRIKRTVPELQKLTVFHEVLHMFGFVDNIADGYIMTSNWVLDDPLPSSVYTLSPAQIRKVQARDYPR
jgi:hypothetical protein